MPREASAGYAVPMAKRSSSSKKGPAGKPLGPDCRVVLLRGKEAFLRAQHTTGFKEKLADAQTPPRMPKATAPPAAPDIDAPRAKRARK